MSSQCSSWVRLLCLAVVAAFGLTHLAVAADPAFVGALALAVDEDVATELGLEAATREKLLDLIDDREAEALELVLSSRDEPEEKRTQLLADFVAESEAAGFKLLTPQQQAVLRQTRIARAGMSTLAEAEIRDALKLNAAQQSQIAKLNQQMSEAMTRGGEASRRATAALYERRLAGVLSPAQRLQWEKMAGFAAADDELDSTVQPPNDEAVADATDPPADNSRDGQPEESAATTDADEDEKPIETSAATDGDTQLKFNFAYAPWKTVLEWFAEQADLSLELTTVPEGTFNYTDSRAYTPAEAIDLLNSVLLTKGYTLLRHRRMLMVINLEDGIPPNLVETVPVDELDSRGKFELISTLFKFEHMSAEEAEDEVKTLLGPQGSIVVLPKSGALLVTETGGRLRVIRDLLKAAEKPDAEVEAELNQVELKHTVAEEVLAVVRQLMGLPEDRNAAADGSLRIATDSFGTKLFITGEAEQVAKVKEILELVDVPDDSLDGLPKTIETPQLEVYPVQVASPESVLAVMQTLMAGQPDVRLATDAKTGHLVALARPSQHATIRATLEQMQKDGSVIEVIQLRLVDPQLAVLSINKLFGADGEEGSDRAPKVDADPTSGQLLIRGTQDQVDQIRTLLEKMGESDFGPDGALANSDRGNVRMLPLTGSAARNALEQIEMIWPTMHRNKIRVVTPSSAVRAMRSGGQPIEGEQPRPERIDGPGGINFLPEDFQRFLIEPRRPQPKGDVPKEAPPKQAPQNEPPAQDDSQASRMLRRRSVSGVDQTLFRFASVQDGAALDREIAPPPADSESRGESKDIQRVSDADTDSKPPAEIIVAPGPSGILIASEDTAALDEFELLLDTLASRASNAPEYTVFYLKYARAEAAAELLNEVLGGGGGGGGSSGGGGGGLLGSLAGAALGDSGGGLLGSLLGMGGGGGGAISTTGSVAMVADRRLNALIVEANPTDLDTIEQLLQVIDQEASPEDVQTFARPRLIPVFHTDAAEIAGVVRDVYSQRLAGGSSSRRQPSPEEFIRALRGGGGRGGSSRSAQQEEQNLTIGVDERSNSLVVSASEPLFQEVKALVEQLDQAGAEETETMRVINIRGASPELVQQALVSITGGKVTASSSSVNGGTPSGGSSNSSNTRGGSSDDQRRNDERAREEFRRRIEMFNALQRSGGFGSRDGGGGRPGGGTQGGGGRPGGGGRGPGGGR